MILFINLHLIKQFSMKKTLLSLIACLLMGTATCQVQVLTDPSLEASGAANNGVWISTSSNYGTTWCTIADCGSGGGPMVPKTGTYYSWFGGTPSAETGTLKQTFNVASAGTAELKFWWVIPLRDATDIFKVEIDGTEVYALESNTNVFTDYQEKTIALGNLATGSHTIRFYSQKTSGHSHNVALDDVTINVTSGMATQNIGLSSGINIYTNGADNTINISNKTSQKKATIGVYDASGKLLLDKTYDISTTVVISTKEWKTGMYILKIKTEQGVISKKVIVK